MMVRMLIVAITAKSASFTGSSAAVFSLLPATK